MRTRKSNVEETTVQSSGCCTPTNNKVEKSDPCCEQPADNTPCCDKTESKEVNAEKTGCC